MTNTSPELETLRAALDAARRHVLSVADQLSDDELTTATLPSGWTPVELIRHLTLGGERYWVSSIIAGHPLDWIPEGERADWQTPPDIPPTDVIDAYRGETAASDAALDSCDPSAAPGQRDPMWDEWGIDFPTVRSILVHLIVETATHAGHLDATVELIDGRQHLVLE